MKVYLIDIVRLLDLIVYIMLFFFFDLRGLGRLLGLIVYIMLFFFFDLVLMEILICLVCFWEVDFAV